MAVRWQSSIVVGFRVTVRRLYSTGCSKPSGAPKDVRIKWFYATDSPKSKPEWHNYVQEKEPEKFLPFSDYDSSRIERNYQRLNQSADTLVPVNEDRLFQVDLNKFELSPVYWEGPIYEVRRGLWISSSGVPLSKEVTELVEEGFLRKKPYKFEETQKNEENTIPKVSKDVINRFNKQTDSNDNEIDIENEKDIVNLDNGKLVLYFDSKNAVIFPRSMDSSFQIGVIRNLGPTKVSLVGVEHIQRGFTSDLEEGIMDKLPSNPIPSLTSSIRSEVADLFKTQKQAEQKKERLEDEKATKSAMESDFDNDNNPANSKRKIDHLVLCIHGIGQILGHKYESVNFTHSINVMRNTMKTVFENNPDMQKLVDDKDNNHIQILPISWRHKIDFHPEKTFKDNTKLPTLSQLSLEGIRPLRNLLGDVVLDILLYYEPKYIKQVFEVVVAELNRVYHLYKERNPEFNGKVHIMGHSLGSAISFDILANQIVTSNGEEEIRNKLDFDVESLFCVGSPVGVFKILEQKGIGSPKWNDSTVASPKCQNLYNIFHPCDPIGYRIEPLIMARFAKFKPETIQFALKGFNTQFEELASIGDEISEKIKMATHWFSRNKPTTKSTDLLTSDEEKINDENALGDILTSITSSSKVDAKDGAKNRKFELSDKDVRILTDMNSSGRVDYCLPQGVFDISLLSAVSAHVSYFEDVNTAGFIMKELLRPKKKIETIKVTSI